MNVNGFTRSRRWATKAVACGFVWLLAMGGSSSCEAARVRHYSLTPSQAQVYRAWTNFLAAGPDVWSTRQAPSFTPEIRRTIWQVLKTDSQADQLANPMIDYLLWRQSLNTARFDFYHPRVSRVLNQLLEAPPTTVTPSLPTSLPVPQTTPTVAAPQGVTPPTVSSPPLVAPATQTVAPPAVPEPSSILLALGMTACGLWWRRRLRPNLD